MSVGKTIRIRSETYEKLAEQGTLSETFDSVILRLLKKAEGLETPDKK